MPEAHQGNARLCRALKIYLLRLYSYLRINQDAETAGEGRTVKMQKTAKRVVVGVSLAPTTYGPPPAAPFQKATNEYLPSRQIVLPRGGY
jgi:hypothetical protein